MNTASTMIPAGTECRNATTTEGMAPSVAPTSGMRSASATQTASGAAKGTPNTVSDTKATKPAMTLINRLPAT